MEVNPLFRESWERGHPSVTSLLLASDERVSVSRAGGLVSAFEPPFRELSPP